MGMRQSFHVRLGVAEDAGRLAVLVAQVWLHTYATDGISPEIAAYVLAVGAQPSVIRAAVSSVVQWKRPCRKSASSGITRGAP